MILKKSFGEKTSGVEYKDRVGAYAILVEDDKVAVIKTQNGYFLPGGGLDIDETFEECIKRECLEEVGMSVIVKDFICKGDKYGWIDSVGYMHAIGYFYFVQGIDIISEPIEKDHELVWLNIENCCECMYLEHQAWAVNQAFMRLGNNNFKKIDDIKGNLNNKKVLSILAQSIYMPTEEKLNTLVNEYLRNTNIVIYGYIEDNQIEGIIVLDTTNINNIVILNIAVNKRMQHKGIGSKLIDYAITSLNPKILIAETDDDAVDFYRKSSFEIISLDKKYGNSNRYECKYIY